MPDPRLELTAQDLAYAARGLRVLARQAEARAADPTFHASREIFGEAARTYDELAGKFELIANNAPMPGGKSG
jgi:hypothetical protein